MSQQVTVDYEGLSIKIQAECDTAVHSLCRIDKVLERIHKTADKLETTKVKEYEVFLLQSKETIKDKIEKFKQTLSKYQEIKSFVTNNHDSRYDEYEKIRAQLEKQSQDLTTTVTQLTGSKLEVIDQMIEEGLLDAGKESAAVLFNKMNGVIQISDEMISKISQVSDVSLRELLYREIIKEENKSSSFDSLLKKAQEEYDVLLGKKTKKVIAEYKEELQSSGITTEALDKATTIDEATKIANDSITDEKVRKETLKVIIKAIKERGFIVDTKNNLKIDKERNVVKLVALKASGQMAEFEVQLNGKFMYHFDEYEGHACKKDIEPFLEDLKNIYDINILHEEVTWENPDKIQTQKYQYINKNKGTN